ncbi:hypothetical protein ACHAXR_003682 [Thalassiosira sp. AJA248-18]
MQCSVLFLLAFTPAAAAFSFVPSQHSRHTHHAGGCSVGRSNADSTVLTTRTRMTANNENDEQSESSSSSEEEEQAPETSNRYDVSKLAGGADGEGFNQFDPVLTATGFLSRRFGIVGGLAVFAALALVEGKEILKGLDDATPEQGSGETITMASGLKYTEILIGKGGSAPLPGYIIGLRATVKIGDRVIYETAAGEKPVAFKYGQRPFQNVICEGVEQGIRGMKVGGKRVLEVPASLAPEGVELPPGVPLIYEVELTEVLSSYF